MNINRQKLVDLIAEESGLPAENVNNQLSELIKRVEESSEKGKALEIKDFGMFYKSEEGDVTFDPSEELETEVNFRYVGMEPIEVRQSLTTATGVSDADEDSEDEDLADFEDIDSVPVPVVPEGEKNGKSVGNGIQKTGSSSEDGVFGKKKSEENRDEHAELRSEKNPATALITTFVTLLVVVIGVIILVDTGFFDGMLDQPGQNESEPVVITDEGSPVEPSQAEPGVAETVTSEDSEAEVADVEGDMVTDPSVEGDVASEEAEGGLADSPVSVTDSDGAEATSDPADSDTETDLADSPVSEPAAVQGSEVSENAEMPEPSATEAPASADFADAAISEEGSPYGLMGNIQMIDSLFYTIVVHSFSDETVAREQTAILEEEGYRAITLSADLSELGQRWRVGIGQFASIAEAGETAENLPEGFTDNYFIGLIK